MKLIDYPVLIVVWTQEGCPACEEYKPVFSQVAARYAQCVPAVIIRAEDYLGAADYYSIQTTPTTMILRMGRRSVYTLHGAVGADQIEHFFGLAMRGLDCQLG